MERAFKPAMPAFMRAFLVAQAFLPVEDRRFRLSFRLFYSYENGASDTRLAVIGLFVNDCGIKRLNVIIR